MEGHLLSASKPRSERVTTTFDETNLVPNPHLQSSVLQQGIQWGLRRLAWLRNFV